MHSGSNISIIIISITYLTWLLCLNMRYTSLRTFNLGSCTD